MFTVNGRFGDEAATVTWDDGEISSESELLLALLRERVRSGETVDVPTMPMEPSLSDPLAFLFMTIEIFDDVTSTSGDVPELPDVPAGAVA